MATAVLLLATALLSLELEPTRIANSPKTEPVQQEMKRLQGTWTIVSGEQDGKKIVLDNPAKPFVVAFPQISKPLYLNVGAIWIVVQGDQLTVNEKERGIVYSATYGLDVTGKEGKGDKLVADIVRHLRFSRQLVYKAIYILDKDELRICYAQSGNERPISLETKPNSGLTFLVLRRRQP